MLLTESRLDDFIIEQPDIPLHSNIYSLILGLPENYSLCGLFVCDEVRQTGKQLLLSDWSYTFIKITFLTSRHFVLELTAVLTSVYGDDKDLDK